MGIVMYDTWCDPFVAVPLPVNITANVTEPIVVVEPKKPVNWNAIFVVILAVFLLVIILLVVIIIGQSCCGWSCNNKEPRNQVKVVD